MTAYCNGSSIHPFIYYQQQGSDVRWNLNEHHVYIHHDVGISWVSSLIHGTLRFDQNVWQMINEKYWYYLLFRPHQKFSLLIISATLETRPLVYHNVKTQINHAFPSSTFDRNACDLQYIKPICLANWTNFSLFCSSRVLVSGPSKWAG